MKKQFVSVKLLLLTIITSMLVSCSGLTTINPDRLQLDKAYKFNANIKFGENNAVAQFERVNANMWEVTLMEPYALEGMSLKYEEGDMTAEFEGMSADVTENNAVYNSIIAAFENAVSGEGREIISSGEEIIIHSKAGVPINSYELVLDKTNLEPLSLKMPQTALTVEFSEVQMSQIVQVIVPSDPMEEYGIVLHE